MIRRLICLLALLGIVFNGFSQCIDSLINIKGYYVTRFLKEEIFNSYNQKINKLKGKLYTTPIDYKAISFFIPLCIENRTINKENEFVKIISIENNLHKDTIYYLPISKEIETYIKKAFNSNIDLSKEICIFSEAVKISPYYIDPNENKYLYKCIFIDGEFMKTIISNTELGRFPFHLDIDSVDKNIQFIDLFFLVKINSYSTIVKFKALKEWVPYNEK